MKPLVIKSILFGSLIFFGSVLLVMLIGFIACLAGAEEKIFCGTLSCMGAIILIATTAITALFVTRSLIRNK